MFDPKKAGEEADRMIAELNQPAQAEDQPSTEEAITTQDIDTTEGTTEVAVSQESQPAPQNDSALAELKKQLDAAEQRWKVLQGMIDKKDSEIENMRTLFAQMQAAPPAEDQGVKVDTLDFQTQKDAFGEDWVDMVTNVSAKIAAKVVRDELSKFKPSMDKMEQSVADVQQTTGDIAYDRFTSALTAKVNDWEQLNTDQGFLNWLNQVDEFVGVQRLALLRDAFSKFNAGRVAKFFAAYKDEAGLNTPVDAAPAAPKPDVRQFVTPSKSRTPPPPSDQSSAKQWSRADISRLYDDKMRGKITQSKFEELERDLFKAQREGRVAA